MKNGDFIKNSISFINSQDIRKYLYDIDFKPNLLQAAFFIYKSKIKSLLDKHLAWKELCEKTVDVSLNEEVGWKWKKSDAYGVSVHELLCEYMRQQNEWMEFFYQKDERAVYSPTYVIKPGCFKGNEDYNYEHIEDGALFSSFETVQAHVINELEMFSDVYEGYSICKKFINDENTNYIEGHATIYQSITVNFNNNHEVIDFFVSGFSLHIEGVMANLMRYPENIVDLVEREYQLDIENDFFNAIWFSIPIPFKRGDIVVGKSANWMGGAEPFVLLNAARVTGYDSSDMNASGWSVGFYKDPTEINDDVMVDLLDLEYYRGEYNGMQRLLPVLATFESGKLDAWSYQKLTEAIINESRVGKSALEIAKEYNVDREVIRILEEGKSYVGE